MLLGEAGEALAAGDHVADHLGLVVALHACDRHARLLGRHLVGFDHPGTGGAADAADRGTAITAAARHCRRHPVGHLLPGRGGYRRLARHRLAGAGHSLPLARHHGALGRVATIVAADPLEDGPGQLILVAGSSQQLLFRMVGDEAGFHQHGGNVRRLEHRQAGVLRCLLVQPGNPSHGAQYLATHLIALGPGLVHGEIEEGLRQIGIGVGFGQYLADAAQQFPLLLLLLQPAAHLAVGAIGRQHPDRGAARRGVVEAVRMHGHQQIRLGLAGDFGALVEVDEVVTTTGHHGAHARLAVDQRRQLLGHRQGHPFLVGAARAYGAGIFPAMARIDGDDDGLALAADGSGLRRGAPFLFIGQIDHQAMAIGAGRCQREHHRLDGGAEIQHQTHAALFKGRALADLAHQLALVLDASQVGGVARPLEIDHQATRAAQGEVVEIGGAAHVEHHPGIIRRWPDPHTLELIRPGG